MVTLLIVSASAETYWHSQDSPPFYLLNGPYKWQHHIRWYLWLAILSVHNHAGEFTVHWSEHRVGHKDSLQHEPTLSKNGIASLARGEC